MEIDGGGEGDLGDEMNNLHGWNLCICMVHTTQWHLLGYADTTECTRRV